MKVVAVLSKLNGSVLAAFAVALSLIRAPGFALKLTTIFTSAPVNLVIKPTVGMLHVIVLPDTVHEEGGALTSEHDPIVHDTVPKPALTKLVPAGSVSLKTILSATDGPRSMMPKVKVRGLP